MTVMKVDNPIHEVEVLMYVTIPYTKKVSVQPTTDLDNAMSEAYEKIKGEDPTFLTSGWRNAVGLADDLGQSPIECLDAFDEKGASVFPPSCCDEACEDCQGACTNSSSGLGTIGSA